MTTLPSPNNSSSTTNNNNKSVHIVLQRYRSCKLLLHETEWVSVGTTSSTTAHHDETNDALLHHETTQQQQQQQQQQQHCGLLVYVSFANTADRCAVQRAAQSIVQIPVLTTGQWGDGVSQTQSLLQLAAATLEQTVSTSLVLVPQANLISKVCVCIRVYVYLIFVVCVFEIAIADWQSRAVFEIYQGFYLITTFNSWHSPCEKLRPLPVCFLVNIASLPIAR